MRKLWPLVAALALGMAGPLPAQFTVSGASATNGTNTNAAKSTVPTVGLGQMLPMMSMRQALPNPFGPSGTKTLNFTRMLPNLSWMKSTLFPVRTPSTQYPTSAFSLTSTQKK